MLQVCIILALFILPIRFLPFSIYPQTNNVLYINPFYLCTLFLFLLFFVFVLLYPPLPSILLSPPLYSPLPSTHLSLLLYSPSSPSLLLLGNGYQYRNWSKNGVISSWTEIWRMFRSAERLPYSPTSMFLSLCMCVAETVSCVRVYMCTGRCMNKAWDTLNTKAELHGILLLTPSTHGLLVYVYICLCVW